MKFVKSISSISRPAHFGGGQWEVKNLMPLTLIVGKNGSGKTTLIDNLRSSLRNLIVTPEGQPNITLSETIEAPIKIVVDKIAAERGGTYENNGNLSNVLQNENERFNRRTGSIAREFRSEVASRYDRLMAHISHNDDDADIRPADKVKDIVELLNDLVPKKYKVIKDNLNFKIVTKDTEANVGFNSLSSGEIEMFTLGLECLIVAYWKPEGGEEHVKVLIIDEPDVHIHPDLQSRFLKFLIDLSKKHDIQIIISTHSTVFIASLEEDADASILWMDGYDSELKAVSKRKSITELSAVLGGNMVMQIFLNHKIVLVEGPSDLEMMQQAIKTAGNTSLGYVHYCSGKDEMRMIETGIGKIMASLSDNDEGESVVVSLRDSDGADEIDHRPYVHRYRLIAHELENLILSDEFLSNHDKDISDIDFDEDRIRADIKQRVPILLTEITGSAEANWQNEVGKILGNILKLTPEEIEEAGEFSAVNFFGKDLITTLQGN